MQESGSISIKLHWSWMVIILLFAAAISMPHIQTHANWYDEIFTHIQSGTGNFSHENMSIVDVTISTALTGAASPPLYYIIQNLWSQFAGNTLVSEHILPLLFGLINIAVMYRFGKSLFGETGGLLSASLYGTSTLFLYYMHETRFYTLYPLLIACAGWYYWLLVHRKNLKGRALQAGFVLSIALALYTHYIAGAFILGIAAYHVIVQLPLRDTPGQISKERWATISRLWVNACLLFVPWAAIMFTHLGFESLSDRDAPLHILLRDTVLSFGNNLWFLTIPLLILTLIRWRKPTIKFLWVWFLTSSLLITVVNLFASFLFHPRHIIPLLIIFVLLLVGAILDIAKKSSFIALILVGIWVGAGIFYSSSLDLVSRLALYQRPLPINMLTDMQTVANQCVEENDYIIFSLEDAEFDLFQTATVQYYFQDLPENYRMLNRLLTGDISGNDEESNSNSSITLEQILIERDNFWLMTRGDINNQSDMELLDNLMSENGYIACPAMSSENGAIIQVFTPDEASCPVSFDTCP